MTRWSDLTPPSSRVLRQFAGLWIVFWLAAGAWHLRAPGRPGVALACLAAALAIGPAGLARPTLIRPLLVGWRMAAFPIGWVVSRVALAAIFFGVLTPIGLVFRAIGRDRLDRRRRPGRRSCWRPKPPSRAGSYFRQY